MKRLYFFILIFLISSNIFAQEIFGSRLNAMANAGVAMHDVWSNNSNAAGLAAIQNPVFSVGYENRFSIKELSTKSVVAAIPVKNFVFGGSFISYGTADYHLNKFSFNISRAFGKKIYTAIGLNYHQLSIKNYGNNTAFTVNVGIQFEALPNLWLAAYIANPNQSKFNDESGNLIPSQIKFGTSYFFNDKLIAASEIEKSYANDIDFKLGLEYKILDILALRGGISVNTFKQYAGFGLDYHQFLLDFSVSSHPVLGYSPQISLGYEF